MEKFRAFELLPNPVWIYDFDKKTIIEANKAALGFWEAEDLKRLRARNIKGSLTKAVDATLNNYRAQFEQDKAVRTWWNYTPNRKPKRALCQFSGIRLDDGRMAMLVSVLSEEDELRREMAFSNGGNLCLLFDKYGKLESYSNAVHMLFRSDYYHLSKFVGSRDSADNLLKILPLEQKVRQEISAYLGGAQYYFDMTATWLPNDEQILVNLADITSSKKQLFDARFNANHDYLTGLLNRRGMIDALCDLIQSSTPFHLIFLDLDEFKTINDTYGHMSGDALLKAVGTRLPQAVSGNCHIARFGGDEFVMAVPKDNRMDQAALLTRIHETMRTSFTLDEAGELRVNCSIGATRFPRDSSNMDTLLKQSSMAMHHAKAKGRNRFERYTSSLADKLNRKAQIRQRMGAALENNLFELYFQPIWDCRNNRLCGAEALLRWNDPMLGQVRPDEFIPIAEESGCIAELGDWVLRNAIARLSLWQNRLREPFVLSVNVSLLQLSEQFADRITALLNDYQVPGNQLAIELTESCMMQHYSDVRQILHRITSTGVHLYLDDFGTGYSSLSVIQELPLSVVKLDKSFISNYEQHSCTIVKATLSMCRSFDINVIAEGVETESQRNNLHAHGYQYLQGYLYSPPVAPAKFEQTYLKREMAESVTG